MTLFYIDSESGTKFLKYKIPPPVCINIRLYRVYYSFSLRLLFPSFSNSHFYLPRVFRKTSLITALPCNFLVVFNRSLRVDSPIVLFFVSPLFLMGVGVTRNLAPDHSYLGKSLFLWWRWGVLNRHIIEKIVG